MIAWGPTERALVDRLAIPSLSGAVPRMSEPSMKVTVPVGTPLPGEAAFTLAVKVTGRRETDGWAVDVTVVVVPSWLTAWFTVAAESGDEVGIAAVDGRDRVRADRQARRFEGRPAAAERAGAQCGRAVHEGGGAGGRAAAGLIRRHLGRELPPGRRPTGWPSM